MTYSFFQNRLTRKIIQGAIGIFLIWMLITHVTWDAVWDAIKNVQGGMLILYACAIMIGNALSAYRWQVLARLWEITDSFWHFFQVYVSASFLNNFFPGFIGGDFFRTYAIGHKKYKIRATGLSVILDRLVGLCVLVCVFGFFGGLWILFEPEKIVWWMRWWIVGAWITIAIAASLFFLRALLIQYTKRYIPDRILQKFILKNSVRFDRVTILLGTCSSVLFAMIGIICANGILFFSIATSARPLSFITFSTCILIASLISVAPISLGNIGVKEWAYVIVFGSVGVSFADAVAVVLVGRVGQMLVSCIAIPWYLALRNQNH